MKTLALIDKDCALNLRRMRVSLRDATEVRILADRWRDLQTRSPHTFFTSWSWIGCWLRNLPAGIKPRILEASIGNETVGLAALTFRPTLKHRVFPSCGAFLNETGDPHYDHITIEHNAILADATVHAEVTARCMEFLVECCRDWDELFLRRVDRLDDFADALSGNGKARLFEETARPSYFVDLAALRAQSKDYLSALSANTRYQIRRTLREYEKLGPVRLEAARGIDEAMRYLDALKMLHQAYWIRKGSPGAFANDFFERFHHGLIRSRFAAGEIELLKVSAGHEPVGYLYNLVRHGRVYNYQSGFAYGSNNSLKPGILSHYLAVERGYRNGAQLYDFLAGNNRYKRSLGTHAGRMTWAVVQRDKLVIKAHTALKRLKRRWFDRVKAGSGSVGGAPDEEPPR